MPAVAVPPFPLPPKLSVFAYVPEDPATGAGKPAHLSSRCGGAVRQIPAAPRRELRYRRHAFAAGAAGAGLSLGAQPALPRQPAAARTGLSTHLLARPVRRAARRLRRGPGARHGADRPAGAGRRAPEGHPLLLLGFLPDQRRAHRTRARRPGAARHPARAPGAVQGPGRAVAAVPRAAAARRPCFRAERGDAAHDASSAASRQGA